MPFFGVSNKHVSMKRRNESTVNFDNLITVPTQTASPHKSNELTMALFNAHSVKNPEKRTEIATFLTEFDVEVLFLTETWLGMRGDEAKCTDLTPPGYCMKSFPHSSRGGGLAVIFRLSFLKHLLYDFLSV